MRDARAPPPAARRAGRRPSGCATRRTVLKEQLRQRLSEPGVPVRQRHQRRARPWGPARPSRATSRRPPAPCWWRREGIAPRPRQLLRRRMNGNGAANGKLNGSEVELLAPAGRAVAARQHRRCARRLRQGGRPGARGRRGADAGGRPASARGQSRRGRGRVPAPDRARQGRQRQRDGGSCAIAATPCWATCWPRARSTTRRWPPTREAQREVKALLERDAEHVGLRRDLSVTYDRIGDMHAAKGELDAALESYRQQPRDRRGAGHARSGQARCGSTICPSATTASARCSTRRAIATAALASFRKGLAIAKALALRDPDNVQWQWDLSASHDRIGDVADRPGQARGGAGQLPPRARDRRGAGQARSRPRRLAARPGGQLPQDRLARGASAIPARRASCWRRAAPSSTAWPTSPPTRRSGAPTSPGSTRC